MPPIKQNDTERAEQEIVELREKLEAEKKEVAKLHELRRKAKDERTDLENKVMDLQAKQADTNGALSRLERELSLGSSSPLDWDRGKKGDLVERVVAAFRQRGGSDASLKAAHEALVRQHQELSQRVQSGQLSDAERAGYNLVWERLEGCGLKRGADAAEVAAHIQMLLNQAAVGRKLVADGLKPDEKIGARPAEIVTKNGTRIEVHLHVHE